MAWSNWCGGMMPGSPADGEGITFWALGDWSDAWGWLAGDPYDEINDPRQDRGDHHRARARRRRAALDRARPC